MQLKPQQRFCVTDRVGTQPTGCRLSPRPWTLTCNQTVIRRSGLLTLLFDGPPL